MDADPAAAQALRYAEELRDLYEREQGQRRSAERAYADLEDSYRTTVRALASTLELRDDTTGNHSQRVTRVALRLARAVEPTLEANPELEYGFLLHDLGKVGIPDAVLLKPGPLTQAEREVVQDHPVLGERIVARIPFLSGVAREVVESHHEHWDGRGYPHGLAGGEIPLAARVFAVADAFDAMTNDRPYRVAMEVDCARAEIRRCAGQQFEPALVDAFLNLDSVLAGD